MRALSSIFACAVALGGCQATISVGGDGGTDGNVADGGRSDGHAGPPGDAASDDAAAPDDALTDDAAALGDAVGALDAPSTTDGAPLVDAAAEAAVDAAATDAALGADLAPSCHTVVTYGERWIRAANHPASFDVAPGAVTWDGSCTDDNAGNSFAVLSNGWKPYFAGHGCDLALDMVACPGAPTGCDTRITYGPAWQRPANHPAAYDDVAGRVWASGTCATSGASSVEDLSNGWTPTFSGANACEVSLRYRQCGGLYHNAVLPDCADPGVLRDGGRYVLACTGGSGNGGAFALRTSPDLVQWTDAGAIFPSGKLPPWTAGNFWAPEIHKVGARYVAYYSATLSGGKHAIGAASSASALGPFVDRGAPLVVDNVNGVIDATEFEDASGAPYLAWKVDGNSIGQPTPIRAQRLALDGLSLVGAPTTLITNDQAWEGPVVEGPWVVLRGGTYYLFYSGHSYYNATYAVGVARASSPLGPYVKLAGPILATSGAWVGPGHCSVVDGPSGDTLMVYHAWQSGHVNGPGDTRHLLVDRVAWGGWPSLPLAPSTDDRPLP